MMAGSSREVLTALLRRVVPEGGSRFGLIIGIDVHRDARLNLRCAVADARAVYDLMVDPECGLFPEKNVHLCLDGGATTDAIWKALAELRKKAGPDDTVWIYFAGHAALQGDQSYWVTHDTDVDDLFATALGRDRLNSVLSQLRSERVLLLLDCCHAAATTLQKNPTRSVPTAKELFGRFEGKGIIALASSDGAQKSVELTDVGHGAFTYYLVKGLRGEADEEGDRDGVVTADELWRYLRRKVEDASGQVGNKQTPVLMGTMTHEVALSANAVAMASHQRWVTLLEGMLGLGPDKLHTDEVNFCLDVVRRTPRTEKEQSLIDVLEKVAGGALDVAVFRRLVQADMQAAAGARGTRPQGAVSPQRGEAGWRRLLSPGVLGGMAVLASLVAVLAIVRPALFQRGSGETTETNGGTSALTASASTSTSLPGAQPSTAPSATAAESPKDTDSWTPWRSPPHGWKLWPKGATLRIQFLNGDSALHTEVERVASEWTKYASVTFDFGAQNGDVRIRFENGLAWSFVGTDARNVASSEATMTLPTDKPPFDADTTQTILRHFGMVLGLVNEHMSPNATIRWKKDAVYAYYHAPRDFVDRTVFQKIPASDLPGYREFDPKSIMMGRFPATLTVDGVALGGTTLSESDKTFIAKLYPGCIGRVADPPPGLVPAPEPAPAFAIGQPGQGGLCEGKVFTVKDPVTVYRLFTADHRNSKQTGPLGAYWHLKKPTGTLAEYRSTYGVCPEWNDRDTLNECTLDVGAKVVLGPGQSVACEGGKEYPRSPENQLVVIKVDGKVPVSNCKQSPVTWAP